MKRENPGLPAILTTTVFLALGMVAARGGFEGYTFTESLILAFAGIAGAAIYFGIIHYLLKGWDHIRSRIRG